MIWEPFVLALVLGLLVSAGLYFAYLWPSIEPIEDEDDDDEDDDDAADPAAPDETTPRGVDPGQVASPAP